MTKDAHRRPKDQLIEDDSERLGYKSGRLKVESLVGRGEVMLRGSAYGKTPGGMPCHWTLAAMF